MSTEPSYCTECRPDCPAFDAELRKGQLAKAGLPRSSACIRPVSILADRNGSLQPVAQQIAMPQPDVSRRAEMSQLRNLLVSLGMPLVHLCPDLRLQYFSERAPEVFDVSAQDLGARPPFLSSSNKNNLIRTLGQVFKTGNPATRDVDANLAGAEAWHMLPYIAANGSRQGVIIFSMKAVAAPPKIRKSPAMSAGLTDRQQQIMGMVLAGHPSKNIAADLQISQRTVENHRAAIMQRTGATSLPALARIALGASINGDYQAMTVALERAVQPDRRLLLPC